MTPNTRSLPAEQADLARAYCALWVVVQRRPHGDMLRHVASVTLDDLREAMTDEARLRCSQFERAWSKAHES